MRPVIDALVADNAAWEPEVLAVAVVSNAASALVVAVAQVVDNAAWKPGASVVAVAVIEVNSVVAVAVVVENIVGVVEVVIGFAGIVAAVPAPSSPSRSTSSSRA